MTRYVSAEFLADRYNVDKSTVWRWARNGTLPAPTKFSEQCTRWDLGEVERAEAKIARAQTRLQTVSA
jgi:prophage regulatory protein